MAAGLDAEANGQRCGAAGGALARLGRAIMSQRLRALAVFALAGYVLFAGFRLGLLVAAPEPLVGVTLREFVRCFLVGFRFDSFPMGILCLPLALALGLAPNAAFGKTWFRRAIAGYVAIVLPVLVLTEIAGVCYFRQFGFRLNWFAMDYLRFPRETIGYIWEQYPVVWIGVGLAALGAGSYAVLMRLCWSGSAPAGSVWPRVLLSLVLVGSCVAGIRGGFDRKPLRIGTAYDVSMNNTVSQLALNNIFVVLVEAKAQWRQDRDKARQYPFPESARAAEVARKMFYQPADVDLKWEGNPLWRRTVTGRPTTDSNVVIIILEGVAGRPVGALGHTPSHTPNLDALCRQGLFFDRMYAVGARTCRALVGVLCGHPDVGDQTVLIQTRAQGHFMTLPDVLRARGYQTVFVYGGQPSWDNTKGFFAGGGIDEFIGQDDGPRGTEVNPWGVDDEVTYEKAHERFVRFGDRKFFATILTITNHEPFNAPAGRVEFIPGDSLEVKKLNCLRYADWALGQFFQRARQADYFKRTIFVVVTDHGRDFKSHWNMDVPDNRVPCVILAPGMAPNPVPPGRFSAVASQADIPSTVLALLGGEFDHCFLGRNLLAVGPDDPGFALLHNNHVLGFVRGDRAITMPPESRATLFRVTNDGQEFLSETEAPAAYADLQEKMLSHYSLAYRLFLEVKFCPPEKSSPAAPPAAN
jgi:phosphoglycerol transferase MdoB-like AlkP superfamily enzyme